MTLVTLPSQPQAKTADWVLNVPAQKSVSQITGRRKVVLLSLAPRYTCSVELPPIIGEAHVLAWRAFIGQLKGIANSFRLVAVENTQITGTFPTLSTDNQTGYAVDTQGWGYDGTKLRAGQFVTIADQLLMLVSDVVSVNGHATLHFERYVWTPTTAGGAVTVDRPYALMSLSDPSAGWSVGIGQQYAIKFACEETF